MSLKFQQWIYENLEGLKLFWYHIVYEVLEYYSHVYLFGILKCLSYENRIAIFEIRLSGSQNRSKIQFYKVVSLKNYGSKKSKKKFFWKTLMIIIENEQNIKIKVF